MTSIIVEDRMSASMKSMSNAVNLVISAFDDLDDSMKHSMDASKISQARAEISKAGANVASMEKELEDARSAQDSLNNSLKKGGNNANSLVKSISGMAVVYAGLRAISDGKKLFIGVSDELSQIDARLKRINDGSQTLAQINQEIFKTAQDARVPYMDMASMVGKLGTMAGEAFAGNDEIIDFAEQLNKQYALAGTSQQGIASANLQLTQAMASGVLRGEELNAVYENAPTLIQAIADEMGVTKGQIRELAQEGEVSAEIVKKAILNASDETNKAFAEMPMTFSQSATMMKSHAVMAFKPASEAFGQLINSPAVQSAMEVTIGAIYAVGNAFTWSMRISKFVVDQIYNHWDVLAPVFYTLGAILIGITLAIAVNAGVATASMIAQGAVMVAQWLTANAVLGLTNWQLIAIIATLALVALAISKTGITASDVAGFVGGAINWIIAGIGNLDIAVYNSQERARTLFLNAGRGIANGWAKAMASMQKTTYEMAGSVLNALSSMLNLVMGKFNKVLAVANKFNPNIKPIHFDLGAGMIEKAKAITIPDSTPEIMKPNLKQYNDLDQAFADGRAKGKAIYASMGDVLNKALNPEIMSESVAKGMERSGTSDSLGKIKDNTKEMKETLGIVTEDMSYLRGFMETRAVAIYNFNNKVDVANNIDRMDNETDLDGLMGSAVDRMLEKVNFSMGGKPVNA